MYKLIIPALLAPMAAVAQQPGTLDSSFATNGVLVLSNMLPVRDIAVQSNGRIIAAASGWSGSKLIGVTPAGAVDSTFGAFGAVELPTLEVKSVLIAEDDAVFVVASRNTDTATVVVRLTEDGLIDTTYGLNGWATIYNLFSAHEAAIDADQSIYMVGLRSIPSQLFPENPLMVHVALCRVTPNGQLDGGFGTNGWVVEQGEPSYAAKRNISGIEIVGGAVWIGFSKTVPGPVTGTYQAYLKKYSTEGALLQIRPIHYGTPGGYDDSAFHDFCFGNDTSRCFAYDKKYADQSRMLDAYSTAHHWWVHDAIPIEYGETARCIRNVSGRFLMSVGPSIHHFSDEAFGVDMAWGPTSQGFTYHPNQSHRWLTLEPTSDGSLLAGGHTAAGNSSTFMLARFHDVMPPASSLSLRVFLGGAYEQGSGLMRDALRSAGLLAYSTPYQAPGYAAVNGVGLSTISLPLYWQEGEAAIVDWLWLELLSVADSTTTMATRTGIVHRNGWVTAANGSPIDFGVEAGSYYLRVRHRNHLGVTCSVPLALGPNLTTLDLSDPSTPTFGTEARMDVEGVRMLWPGDVNGNGVVKYVGSGNDRDPILLFIGGNTPTAVGSGYRKEDVNLDGLVKYVGAANDRDIIFQTIGGAEVHEVRIEQRP